MAKKKTVDTICEVSLVLNSSIIHSGEGREFYDHKVYIFNHTFKTFKTKAQLKKLRKTGFKSEERNKILVKKLAQKTARIVIKEQVVETRNKETSKNQLY